MQATITLEYSNEKTAKAIANAISPDNFKTPQGLQIETRQDNNKVITEIDAKTKFETFLATIDDLLSSTSTAEKTLNVIRK